MLPEPPPCLPRAPDRHGKIPAHRGPAITHSFTLVPPEAEATDERHLVQPVQLSMAKCICRCTLLNLPRLWVIVRLDLHLVIFLCCCFGAQGASKREKRCSVRSTHCNLVVCNYCFCFVFSSFTLPPLPVPHLERTLLPPKKFKIRKS